MIKPLMVILLVAFTTIAPAQTPEDSSTLKILADSAFQMRFSDPGAARQLANQVVEMARQKGIQSYEMNGRVTIGYSWMGEFEFERAIEIFREGLALAKSENLTASETLFLHGIAFVYEYQADFPKARDYYSQVIKIARELEDTARLSITLGNLANVYDNLGKEDSAILLQKEAIRIRESRNDPNVHINYNNLAAVYHMMGRYAPATELYLKAAEARKELGATLQEGQTYTNLSLLFSDLNDHEKSILYSQKAEEIYLAGNHVRELGMNYSSQGIEYQRVNDYKRADSLYRAAIRLHEEVGNQRGLGADLHNLGSLLAQQEKTEQAKAYFERSLKIKQESGNEGRMAVTLIELGDVLSQSGKYSAAENYLLKGRQLALDQNDLDQQMKAAEKLADHFQRRNNLRKAFSYQKMAVSLKDSLFNRDYLKKMNQLYVAYETAQTQNDLLEEQSRSQELEQAKAASDLQAALRSTQLITALGGIVMILLGGAFLFYRNKQKEKENIARIRIIEQQKGLKAVISAQEEERKRIARDLHDGIVQQLSGLKLGLQNILPGDNDPDTRKMLDLLDDSTKELREISHQMMPRALSNLGLIPALKDLLETSLGHTQVAYNFETFGLKETDRFEESVEISLYRIVQELINNIIKHSGATKVSVQLIRSGHMLNLFVEDNGGGFEGTTTGKGIGLMNIASRLDTLNGKVNYEPSPEGGTLAIIHIPIKA